MTILFEMSSKEKDTKDRNAIGSRLAHLDNYIITKTIIILKYAVTVISIF